MPYTRPYTGGFQDFPNTTTPINASALNTIDLGTKAANDQFQTVTTAQRATLTPSVGQAVWDSDLKQLMVFMNASGGNAWQPVGNRIVCASTTRPSSPFEGQEIYETDTQKTLVYSGSAWVETSDLDYSPSATVCTSSTRPTTGLFEGQRIYETDTNREFTYSGSGWVQTNQWSTTSGVTGVNNLIVPPYCEIARVATQTINDATDTDISFDTEVHDTDGMFAPTSTTITVNTTGIYVITAEIGLNTTVDIRGDIILYIGGVVKAREVQYGTAERFGLSHIEAITAGTTMKVTAYLDNTANTSRNLTARFRAAWIGRVS